MNKPINKYIDHTLLKPEATRMDVVKLCTEAYENKFYAVCVNPFFVSTCKEILNNSKVQVAAVVGFPLGATTTNQKVAETRECCENGATEIDMVINIGLLKAGNYDLVQEDIAQVTNAAHEYGAKVKVIIETCLLTEEEKIKACEAISMAGADFAKTSTGFSSGGATVEDVALMRKYCDPRVEIKASGGIRDLDTALAMIEAGADRLGVSAGLAIMEEYLRRQQ